MPANFVSLMYSKGGKVALVIMMIFPFSLMASSVGVADWAADWGERLGARTARPVFDMDGSGPQCSYCGAIWPLCGHHHLSTMPTDDDERTTR